MSCTHCVADGLILGRPQGSGGLNTTNKPSFMVSDNNIPPPIAKKPPLKPANFQQISMSDDHYANQSLCGGKIFFKKPLQTLVLQSNS